MNREHQCDMVDTGKRVEHPFSGLMCAKFRCASSSCDREKWEYVVNLPKEPSEQAKEDD